MDLSSVSDGENPIARFFAFDGRVRRITWWINTVACGILTWFINVLFVQSYISPYTLTVETSVTNKPLYYLCAFVIVARMLSISVRRWHDMDSTGQYAIFGAYPLLVLIFPTLASPASTFGAFFSIAMWFLTLHTVGMQGYVPGDADRNTYGEAPPAEQRY